MYYTEYRSYIFRSSVPLEPETLDRFVRIFRGDESSCARTGLSDSGTVLGGRTSSRFTEIPETGPVAVKFYSRGGLIRHISSDRYFYTGSIRSGVEFSFLSHARKAGVSVPFPLAYASKGRVFYRAWLITRRIQAHTSFAELCLNDPERAFRLVPSISRSVRRLVEKGICHVDLHPGNVLIDWNDVNYIIDFDKAFFYSKSRAKLAEKYRNRWARAVRKHGLPESFAVLDIE
ncbi:MAG: lipopolysaccharide kinase InaA family protein [Desulfobacteraceae bacterium]